MALREDKSVRHARPLGFVVEPIASGMCRESVGIVSNDLKFNSGASRGFVARFSPSYSPAVKMAQDIASAPGAYSA